MDLLKYQKHTFAQISKLLYYYYIIIFLQERVWGQLPHYLHLTMLVWDLPKYTVTSFKRATYPHLLFAQSLSKASKQFWFSLLWSLSKNQSDLWCHVGFAHFLFEYTVSPQRCRTAALYWQSLIKGASVPRNWIYFLVKGKISIWLSMTRTELLCESVHW